MGSRLTGNNPQVGYNPVFVVGQNLAGFFLLKTDTNPYSWPYPTHEVGSSPPTDPRMAENKGGYDLIVTLNGSNDVFPPKDGPFGGSGL